MKHTIFLVYAEHKFIHCAKAFLWQKTDIAVATRNGVGLKATEMQEKS
jgi:hypothetical protein